MIVFLPALILILSARFGSRLFARLNFFEEWWTTFLAGGIVGITVYAVISFQLYAIFHMGFVTMVAPLLFLAILDFLPNNFFGAIHKPVVLLPKDPIYTKMAVIFLVILVPFSWKVLFFSPTGDLMSAYRNVLADFPWHTEIFTSLSDSQKFPPQNPSLAGMPLHYSLLVDYLSAILYNLGWRIDLIFRTFVFVLVPWLLLLLFIVARTITQSVRAAGLSVILFVFSGATLGFSGLVNAFQSSRNGLIPFLLHLPDGDLTAGANSQGGFFFYNPVLCALIPQRSLLLGTPLAFTLILLLMPRPLTRERALVAGIVAGCLPLAHAHTALALIPVIIGFFFTERSTKWGYFLVAAAIIGVPQLAYLASADQHALVVQWHWGWMKEGTGFFNFWFRNTGIFFLLCGICLLAKPRRDLRVMTVGAIALFFLGNCIQIAPWIWDNYKIFYYACLFGVPAAGSILDLAWGRGKQRRRLGLVLIIVLFQSTSALLDFYKILNPWATLYGVWDAEAYKFSRKAREIIPPDTVVAHFPTYNSTISLIGRASYLGFPGHIWSHGLNSGTRETALRDFYTGKRLDLPYPGADFVIVGPQEKAAYPGLKLPQFLGTAIFTQGSYALYKFPGRN